VVQEIRELKLKVEPYNGIWLNCIYNNLIAILNTHNPTFEAMAFTLPRNYTLCKPIQPEIPMIFNEVGSQRVLEVKIELPNIHEWFEFKDVAWWTYKSVDDAIREHLKMGYYLFVDLDRYYFPGGVEYLERSFVHPSFFYGFNDDTQSYTVIEDCITPRIMEVYELPYDILRDAFQQTLQNKKGGNSPTGSPTGIRGVRLVSQDDYEYKLETQLIVQNLNRILNGSEKQQVDPYLDKYFGVECISEYANTITEVFPKITLKNLRIHFPLAAFPLDFQKGNLGLIETLVKHKLLSINKSQLITPLYEKLATLWEVYRNLIYKYIHIKQSGLIIDELAYFEKVKIHLIETYNLEKTATQKFLDVLSNT
jgi:hypothetical protein